MKNFEKKRGGSQLNFLDEIIVDNFAGGGGASTGMELATGRPVAIAINHDPDAILMAPDKPPIHGTPASERVGCRPERGLPGPPGGACVVLAGL